MGNPRESAAACRLQGPIHSLQFLDVKSFGRIVREEPQTSCAALHAGPDPVPSSTLREPLSPGSCGQQGGVKREGRVHWGATVVSFFWRGLLSRRSSAIGHEWIGKTLEDKYVVTGVLGRGGMGVVLRAENKVINRPVAVKLLHANLVTDDVTVERFQREARAAAGTGHEHFVEIFDLGTT